MLDSGVQVQYERLTGCFFICMIVEIAAIAPETQGCPSDEQPTEMQVEEATKHISAINPGIRTFATLDDPGREMIVEWGNAWRAQGREAPRDGAAGGG